MYPALAFLLSAAIVAAAGMRLARDGDVVAEGTGLGGAWVGVILVAAVTSLPELTTDINAVLQGAPDLAVGDLFGSCMANLLILAVADQFTRQPRMLTRVAVNQVLVGTLGILLMVLAVLGIVTADLVPQVFLGWAVLVIGATYVLGIRLLHLNRAAPPFRTKEQVSEARPSRRRLRHAAVGFLVAGITILIAAPFLASSAAALAAQLGVSEGFVGVILLAVTTSFPEAAVSIGCIRIGAYELAVGNLLGSNCFNMVALLPLDLVHGRATLLASVSPGLTIGALAAVLMTGIAMLDILDRSERRVWKIEPGPAVMVLIYGAAIYAIRVATG